MTHSDLSSATQSTPQKIPNWLIYAFLVLGFIGFVDATYLTVVHYFGLNVGCIITDGCDVVTTSTYSEIFGIPMALLGALFYLTVFISSLLYIDRKFKYSLAILPALGSAGFIFSLYLVYLQAFILYAFCFYCLVSAGTSTLLFIFGIILFVKTSK